MTKLDKNKCSMCDYKADYKDMFKLVNPDGTVELFCSQGCIKERFKEALS